MNRETFLSEAETAHGLEAEAQSAADKQALAELRSELTQSRSETLATLGHQALLPDGSTAPLAEVRQAQADQHDMSGPSHLAAHRS